MTDVIGVIKEIGIIITPIVLAYIAYRQIKLSKSQENLRKEVDGKMTKLLEATEAKAQAEGKLEGKAEQKEESATVASEVVHAIKKDPNIDITKTKH